MLAEWKHCPRCGAHVDVEGRKARCAACGYTQYESSSPTASAVLVDEAGRVLLARRAVDPERGKWDLPGGFLESGEHPLDGLRRELREETGLDVEPLRFLGAWMDVYGESGEATLNLYWVCRAEGDPHAADDIDETRWFEPEALPSDAELAFSANALVLAAWRQEQP